jgi:hypothetical protein
LRPRPLRHRLQIRKRGLLTFPNSVVTLSRTDPDVSRVITTLIRFASGRNEPGTESRLGIGLNGTLPWPRIKTDMSFFARVTSRPPTPGIVDAVRIGVVATISVREGRWWGL